MLFYYALSHIISKQDVTIILCRQLLHLYAFCLCIAHFNLFMGKLW